LKTPLRHDSWTTQLVYIPLERRDEKAFTTSDPEGEEKEIPEDEVLAFLQSVIFLADSENPFTIDNVIT
jgi:hypothetical protein